MKAFYTLVSILAVCTLLSAQKAPDFTITDYNGISHKLYDHYLDEEKVVVLKIMFVACPPCNTAAPVVQDLYEMFGEGQDDVQFFDLSNKSWDSNASLEGFADKHDLTFPGAGADGGALSAVDPYVSGTFGRFRGTPTFVIIDSDGNVDFDVPLSLLRQGIEDALEGEGGCSTAFSGQIEGPNTGIEVKLKSDVVGSQVYNLNEMGNPEYQYECEFPFPAQALEYYLVVEKDGNDLAGVSTKDIVFTVRHLLGVEPFETIEEKIAADFTANDVVSARDISEMRKLILGVNNENQDHNSWRFWNVETDFSGDSSGILIPDLITQVPLMDIVDSLMSGDFKGVKLGDVSGEVNNFFTPPSKTRNELILRYEDSWIKAGERVTVDIHVEHEMEMYGIQTSLINRFKQLNAHTDLNLEIYQHQTSEAMNLMAYTPYPQYVDKGESVIRISFVAESNARLSDLISLAANGTPSYILMADGQELPFTLLPVVESNETLVNPNPFSQELRIENIGSPATIKLFSSNGVLVQEVSAQKRYKVINTSHLGSGTYILSIETSDGINTTKVIKP